MNKKKKLPSEEMLRYVALDLETKGLPSKGKPPEILCWSYAAWNGEEWESEYYAGMSKLRETVEYWNKNGIIFVFHNACFEVGILEMNGIFIDRYEDTKLMMFCLQTGEDCSLEALGEKIDYPKLDKPWKKHKDGDYPLAFSKELAEYCQRDTLVTIAGFFELWEEMHDNPQAKSVYETIELPLTQVVVEMEATGLSVDVDKFEELARHIETSASQVEEDCYSLIGRRYNVKERSFKNPKKDIEPVRTEQGEDGKPVYVYEYHEPINLSSSDQVATVLIERGWKPKVKTATGKPATSGTVLELVDDELASKIVELKQLQKLASSFTTTLPEFMDGKNIIRGHLNQTGARTGRFSCSNPNLQQVPKRSDLGKVMRNTFVSKDGMSMIVGDLSNIEVRVLAYYLHLVGDDNMANAFLSGENIHDTNAVSWNMERSLAKIAIFLIVYGGGAGKLAARARISYPEAKNAFNLIEARCPALSKLKKMAWSKAKGQGGKIQNLFGRTYHYPDLFSTDGMLRSRAERQCFNALIQGSSADIFKTLLVQSTNVVWSYNARFAVPVHDELIVYADNNVADTVASKLTELWSSSSFINPVPIEAEFGVGKCWGEIH